MKEINFLNLWIIVSILETVRHWYVIERMHRSPNKVLSYVARAVIAIQLMILDYHPWWISVPAYVIVDWVIHDYFLNLLRDKQIWYLNNTGPIDRMQHYPDVTVWFVWKVIAFVGLTGMYYLNY